MDCWLSLQCGGICRNRPQCNWSLLAFATVRESLLRSATVTQCTMHCGRFRQIQLHCGQSQQIHSHCARSRQIQLHCGQSRQMPPHCNESQQISFALRSIPADIPSLQPFSANELAPRYPHGMAKSRNNGSRSPPVVTPTGILPIFMSP